MRIVAFRPLLLAGLVAACAHTETVGDAAGPSDSKHFRLEKLADGVWAAVATPGGYAICNMGIIDLGQDVVLFDAGMDRQAAADLVAAAKRLTGRTPTTVVYSHGHNDHVRGAMGLPEGVTIIGTAGIKADILEDAGVAKAQAEAALKKLKVQTYFEQLEAQTGHPGQAHFWRGYLEAIADGSRDYAPRLPTKYMDGDSLTLTGPKRKVILKALSGHTQSDIVAVLPDDHIVFTGDLLFVSHHPFLGDSPSSDRLLKTLDSLEAEGATHYVPGHGKVSGPEAIKSLKEYVVDLKTAVAEAKGQGLPVDWFCSRTDIPAPFAAWWFGRFYPDNIRALYKEGETPKPQ